MRYNKTQTETSHKIEAKFVEWSHRVWLYVVEGITSGPEAKQSYTSAQAFVSLFWSCLFQSCLFLMSFDFFPFSFPVFIPMPGSCSRKRLTNLAMKKFPCCFVKLNRSREVQKKNQYYLAGILKYICY